MKLSNLRSCTGCARRRQALGDFFSDFGTKLLTGAASGFASGAGSGLTSGGGAMMPSNTNVNTVSPQIVVNPQISPIFQQQFQPSNSPISAGTSQNTPVTSAGQGENALPFDPNSDLPVGQNNLPPLPVAPLDYNKWITYGSLGLIGLLLIKQFKKPPAPVRRSIRRKVTQK